MASVQMTARCCLLLAILAGLGTAQSDATPTEVVHRYRLEGAADTIVTLRNVDGTWTGSQEASGGGLRFRMVIDPLGGVVRYERFRGAAKDGRPPELLVTWEGGAYHLAEDGPLGRRVRKVASRPLALLHDPVCPFALLPGLWDVDAGRLAVLDLRAGVRREDVRLERREGGARYLALPGSGLTLLGASRAAPRGVILPGNPPPHFVLEGALGVEAAPWPRGTRDEPLVFGGPERPVEGRLALPAGPGPVPLVLLLSDSGDRDAEGRRDGGDLGLTGRLARELAAAGVGSLRFPKTGAKGFEELLTEARAALDAVVGHAARAPGPVAILGHGEGGLLAATLARGDAAPRIGAVVALAPPARPLPEAMAAVLKIRQVEVGGDAQVLAEELEALDAFLKTLRATPRDELVAAEDRLLKDLLDIDPLETFVAQRKPVFLIYGSRDERVPEGHRSLLRAALSLESRAAYRFQVLDAARHDFGLGDPDSPADVVRPLHPALLPFIVDFLKDGGLLPR